MQTFKTSLLLIQVAYVLGGCPKTWSSFKDFCYLFNEVSWTYQEASDICQQRQGQLSSVASREELDYLTQEVGSRKFDFWFGLRQERFPNGTTSWYYVDGTAFSQNITLWGNNQPTNTPGSDCAYYKHNERKWFNAQCRDKKGYICKRSNDILDRCDLEGGWHPVAGKCFKYVEDTQTWWDARTTCGKENADLMVIDNDAKLRVLSDTVTCRDHRALIWLGLSDTNVTSEFRWVDGSPVTTQNWDQGEPKRNSFGDNCVEAVSLRWFSWRVAKCNNQRKFICEKDEGQCEDGWRRFKDHCYLVHMRFEEKKTWTDAAEYCEKMGGKLMNIKSAEEQAWFNGVLRDLRSAGRDFTWIGVSNQWNINSGKFLWTDTSPITYSNWQPTQPQNVPNRLDCGRVTTDDPNGKWSTQHCFRGQSFICKLPIFQKPRPVIENNEYSCLPNWGLAQGQCYLIVNEPKTWSEASDYCRDKGANVAIIDTAKQESWLADNMRSPLWFGARKANGQWGWSDGYPIGSSFQNWGRGEPAAGKDCGYLQSDSPYEHRGQWRSRNCNDRIDFACSRMAAHVTAPTVPSTTERWWPQCGWGWQYDVVSNYCYRIQRNRQDWPTSLADCRRQGGDLASIHSIHQQAFLTGLLQTKYATGTVDLWLGANMRTGGYGWRWSDGSPFNFFQWRSGSPARPGNKLCVAVSPTIDARWHNEQCNNVYSYICQKLPSDVTTTPTLRPSQPPADCTGETLLGGQHWIQDELLEASAYLPNYPPSMCRLNTQSRGSMPGGWAPTTSTSAEWIGVDFGQTMLVKGVATQGCPGEDSWVTQYQIRYRFSELDIWDYIWDGNKVMLFQGNSDRNTVVSRNFSRTYHVLQIRLQPSKWQNRICVRWELNGCRTEDCSEEKGVSGTRYIADAAITASSSQDSSHAPAQGRLISGKASWIPAPQDTVPWIQYDLGLPVRIRSISTQGTLQGYVEKYKLRYSYNGSRYDDYMDPATTIKIFDGNKDGTSVSQQFLPSTLVARFVKIYPVQFRNKISVKAEINTCLVGCDVLPFINGPVNRLPDAYLQASSSMDGQSGPGRSRLNTRRQGNLRGAWVAKYSDDKQFIQVNFPSVYFIRAVATQGRQDADEWVTSYKILFSVSGRTWITHRDRGGNAVVFPGNWDRDTVRKMYLDHPVQAAHMRLVPVSWNNHISLRWEVYGCPGIFTARPIGCYEEVNDDRDLPYEPLINPPGGMTVELCTTHCYKMDYTYAGLQENKCHCGNSYGRYGPSHACTSVCPGYSGSATDQCGGPNAVSVWTTGLHMLDLRCVAGWRRYEDQCFLLGTDGQGWVQAQKTCRAAGGDLVTVNSRAKQDFLTAYTAEKGFRGQVWIGLSAVKRRMSFEWSDGSPVLFTNWNWGEPNAYQADEDCVLYFASGGAAGKWNDDPCRLTKGYMCQAEPSRIQQPTTPGAHDGCPMSWVGYRWACYSFITRTKSWAEADRSCKTFGGSLVRIDDRFEQTFLSSELHHRAGQYWTDLTDKDSPGTYRWSDGNTNIPFTNWGAGQPNVNNGTCVVIASGGPGENGLWYDRACSAPTGYICEKGREGYTTPVVSSPTASTGSCHPDWLQWGNNCFKAYQYPTITWQGWDYARDDCRRKNADLASFHNQTELDHIWRYTMVGTGANYWIGLRKSESSGFTWSDGSAVSVVNWENNEPKATGQCTRVNTVTGRWQTADCTNGNFWICKIPVGRPVNNTPTVAPPSAGPPGSCAPDSDDWKFYSNRCYYVSKNIPTERLSWNKAESFCNRNGSNLVSIHSADEKNFIWGQTKNAGSFSENFWIGLNELDTTDGWKWSDGSSVQYTNWGPGEPNDHGGEEACVNSKNTEGFWNDDICSFEYRFVCAKRPGGRTVPPTPTPTLRTGACPAGWFQFGDRCFTFLGLEVMGMDPGPQNWTAARSFCQRFNVPAADLASIVNRQEQAFITSNMMHVAKSSWIGLRRKPYDNGYYWVNQREVTFTNWARGSPDSIHDNQCGFVLGSHRDAGHWKNGPCNIIQPFVCEGYISPSAVTAPPPPNPCKPGWEVYGQACYRVLTTQVTWLNALQDCRADGGNLVSINSRYEEAYITTLLTKANMKNPVWIGLSDTLQKGNYHWSDSWPVLYVNWDKDEPNTQPDTSNCVKMNSENGKWSVAPCIQQHYASVCKQTNEKPPYVPPVTNGECPGDTNKLHWLKFGQHCYRFPEEGPRITHGDAQHQCNLLEASLVSIHNQNETAFLLAHTKMRSTRAAWIGLIRTRTVGFTWRDGSPVQYTNWGRGKPENKNGTTSQDCVEMGRNTGLWSDVNCDAPNTYICKTPQVFPPSLPATTPSSPTVSSSVVSSTRTSSSSSSSTRTSSASSSSSAGTSSKSSSSSSSITTITSTSSQGSSTPRSTTLVNVGRRSARKLGAGGIVAICIAVLVVFVAIIVLVLVVIGRRQIRYGDTVELRTTFDNPSYETRELGAYGATETQPTFTAPDVPSGESSSA